MSTAIFTDCGWQVFKKENWKIHKKEQNQDKKQLTKYIYNVNIIRI